MSLLTEIESLPQCWRERARKFMVEAAESNNARDIVRLTAMASTLEYMARELSECIQYWRDRGQSVVRSNDAHETIWLRCRLPLGKVPK